jgi:hypothetical protein
MTSITYAPKVQTSLAAGIKTTTIYLRNGQCYRQRRAIVAAVTHGKTRRSEAYAKALRIESSVLSRFARLTNT